MLSQEYPTFELAPVSRQGFGPASPGGPGHEAAGLPSLDLGAVVRRLVRGWWVLALSMALGLAAGVGYLKITPQLYVSTATLRVGQERRPLLPGTDLNGGREDIRALDMLKTLEQGLVSQNNLRRVIAKNALAADPTFAAPMAEADMIALLAHRVKVELRRGTRLIDVRAHDTDPERARRLAASLADEYLAATTDEAMAEARNKAASLAENARRLSTQIQRTNEELQTYREKHQSISLDKESNLAAEKLKELNNRLAQVLAERNRLEAAQKQIVALGPNPDVDAVLKVQGASASEDVTRLKSELGKQEAEFARLQQRYGPKNPKYIQAKTEITALQAELRRTGSRSAASLTAACAHLVETELGLREQISRMQTEVLVTERVAGPYRLLLSRLRGEQTSFDAVQAELKQSDVAAAAPPSTLVLADAPVAASHPARPQRMLVLGIAGLSGGSLGLGLILLSSLVRRRFDSVAEVERTLELPLLAAVPVAKVGARNLAVLDNPQVERACAESFRTLRTALSVMGKGSAARSVIFVSACSGEGSSFLATNHAISLARQGYRTLLIDGNLHRPSLDDVFFSEPNENGLANYLEGRPAAEKACRPTHVPDLFLLSAGRAVANPSELISGKKLQLLIADAQRWFHRIVIDAPALTRSNDALLMTRQADHTVLVVNARTASRTATGGVVRRLALAGVQPVGFVFNQAQAGAAAWQPKGFSGGMAVPPALSLGA